MSCRTYVSLRTRVICGSVCAEPRQYTQALTSVAFVRSDSFTGTFEFYSVLIARLTKSTL